MKCSKVNNNFALIFHRKLFIFQVVQNCQKFIIDFGFDHICQIFVKLFSKNMKGGSEKSEILCVGQLVCAEKKSRK